MLVDQIKIFRELMPLFTTAPSFSVYCFVVVVSKTVLVSCRLSVSQGAAPKTAREKIKKRCFSH